MSFFAELKRRNVFKVGIAYAIVAWLLIQVASIIVPAYQAPGWVMPIFVTLISLGFPIALFLAWVYELTPEGIKVTTSEGPDQYHTRATGHRLNYFILGVLVLVVAFIVVDNYVLVKVPRDSTTPAQKETTASHTTAATDTAPAPLTATGRVRRYSMILGETKPFNPGVHALIALSPDGSQLAYVVNQGKGAQIYHRSLDQLTAKTLPTPPQLYDVFFSPDGEWLGVTTNTGLYKVSVQGGPPQQLAEREGLSFGGFWGEDGYIYVGHKTKLHRIRATGGSLEPVPVKSELAEQQQFWPWGLPGGTHLLFTVARGTNNNGQIALLNLNSGATRILIQNGYHARYVPTGHIVFMRSESLWAVPFDVKEFKTTGPEVPVVNGVQTAGLFGEAVYAFANDGLLAYLPGGNVQGGGGVPRQLVWVDRQGKESSLAVKADNYNFPRLSPDETQVAVTLGQPGGVDIWTFDFTRNILSRRTFSGNAIVPLWSTDGTHLVYTSFPDYHGLFWVKADGTGQPEKLLEAPRFLVPTAFTPDGSALIYFEVLTGPVDLYTLSLTGEHSEQKLLATEFNENFAAPSPDGRWLAYQSNETGQMEIYVRPYPNVNEGKWQVSTDGGEEPHWRGDGRELFYRKPGNPVTMIAVPVETGSGFQAGTPVELFHGNYFVPNLPFSYDVTADGQRFLMMKPQEQSNENIESQLTSLVYVENWFTELKRLAPLTQ